MAVITVVSAVDEVMTLFASISDYPFPPSLSLFPKPIADFISFNACFTNLSFLANQSTLCQIVKQTQTIWNNAGNCFRLKQKLMFLNSSAYKAFSLNFIFLKIKLLIP